MKTLSGLIGDLLKTRKITQKDLAQKIGIAPGYLGDIKKGRTVGSESSIQAIIDGLMLTKEEEHEVWKAWMYEKGHKETMEYYFKLEEENKRLKKILKEIKEI
ncbi:MAG: helix-turn-helix domain-containing protein [Cetobacterium sp.]